MAKILIIDDDHMVGAVLQEKLTRLGHRTDVALTLAAGLAMVRNGLHEVVLLDVGMPDGDGLEAIPLIRAAASAPEVIIITGAGNPGGAEMAINSGAWDYLQKGDSLEKIIAPLNRALRFLNERGRALPGAGLAPHGIVGSSPAIRECLGRLSKLAGNESSVLINGETGTGKELFARALHDNGPRRGKNFVVLDCTVIPASLVASILFGHCKGAFTGAERNHQGLVRQAHGGTLFLDEVGDLPLEMQKSLLRVLQERRFRPLGDTREQVSDFRLVSATNQDLEAMAEKGLFRRDLLYRLRCQEINLPPLRERDGDIKLLALHFLGLSGRPEGRDGKEISPDFWEVLGHYPWPGNVRELQGAMEHAQAARGEAPTLYARHLPTSIRSRATSRRQASSDTQGPRNFPALAPLKQARLAVIDDFERKYLADLLILAKGSMSQASQMAGISRQHLHNLVRKHGMAGKV